MDWFLKTLGAASLSTLVATLVTLPFTTALFWSWRLRRHMQTVEAVDATRQRNQHEVLMRRADYLSNKVAAAHQIPTDWGRFGHALIHYGFVATYVLTGVILWSRGSLPSPSSSPHFGLMPFLMGVSFSCLWSAEAQTLKRSFQFTRNARATFIEKGCPPDFPVPERYWARRRRIVRTRLALLGRKLLASVGLAD